MSKKIRVKYIGNFEGVPFSTENDVRKAFEHLGHEVVQVQENRMTKDQLETYDYDLLLITGTWDKIIPLEDWLDVMHGCALRGIPTATLHLDTFWGKSRGGRHWWNEPMFHTAYIFTADGDYQKEWKALGKNHIWLPPAVRHDAAHFGTFREEYACDVAFVGSNGVGYHEDVWGYRKELVDFLRDMCKRNGWTWRNPGGDHPKVDRGEDMNDFYASAKVTVGDSLCLKKERSHYWSDRVPEATGRGGFLIMPRIDEVQNSWMMPSYDWGDFVELENTVKFYLRDGDKRSDVRHFNQANTAKNHTYVNRVQTILEVINADKKA